MEIVSGLAVLAAVLSLFSVTCIDGHILESKDAKLFGRVPWALVAIIGYAIIAASLRFPRIQAQLVYLTGALTVYLMVKAYRVKMGCPICFMMWGINAYLVWVVFRA